MYSKDRSREGAELSVDETREQDFWHWVHQCAAVTSDKDHSYAALKAQYVGIRPDATPDELEAAEQRLSSILRV